MTNLNLLDLVYSDTFIGIQKFLNLKDLFNLRCACSTFRDYIDDELTVLKEINVAGCGDCTQPLQLLGTLCENIQTLNFARCTWLTDDLLIPLLKNNSRTLTAINLNCCENLTEKSIQPIIIESKRLRKLNLSKCFFLTVGSLEAFVFHHSHVEELDLSGCGMLTERCLNLMLQKFRCLRVLCLASCSSVTDNVLFSISKYQTEIRHLNLFNCMAISDRGVGALSLNCKFLEVLSVRGCPQVTDRSLNLLRARNVHIDVARNRQPTNLLMQYNDFNAAARRMLFLQV